MLFFGIGIVAFVIRKIMTTTKQFLQYNDNISSSSYDNNHKHSYVRSVFELGMTILANISNSGDDNGKNKNSNKKFSILFWSTAIGYGLFFSVTSGILIYRAEGLSHGYDIISSIPSVTLVSYGPAGYVPTLAIVLTENIGFLIIPINLIIMLVVSVLVGLNAMLSFYAFQNKPKKNGNSTSTASTSSAASFSGLGLIGAATGLFTACPTCASLFIFNFFLSSFAPAVATFTAAFYSLLVAITIPLLLATPVITIIGVRRMQSTNNAVCSR